MAQNVQNPIPIPSILDKIMSSKEDQEKMMFDPQEALNKFFKKLNSKEVDVLKRRYGLFDSNKETLEQIGKIYNVTRERIRQIENTAISKIKNDSEFNEIIKPLENVLTKVINQCGGIVEEQYMLEQLLLGEKNNMDEKAILFIIGELLSKRFSRVVSSEKYHNAWKIITTSLGFIDEIIEELIKIISAKSVPSDFNNINNAFKQTEFYKNNQNKLNEKVIEAILVLSKKIANNPFSEYGLAEWGSILPKRMNDKIYLILKKEGKPMHFVEIANKITQIFKKKAYPPTVHNELILNKQYVLVGRGIYALKEWGYKKGVVAEVLEEILRNSQTPMTKEGLVEAVLKQRLVKVNTIYLALTNKNRFKKLADGRYSLAEPNS